MTTKKKPPATLGKSGSALWREVLAKYGLRADELRILEDACAERDLIEQLSAGLQGAPMIVKGSMGQEVINPIVSELRQHRSTFAALMGKLKLPDDDAGSSDSGGALSAKNRAAAQARWASRGA